MNSKEKNERLSLALKKNLKKRKIIGLNMVFCLNMFEILVSKTFILKQDCFGAWPN